MSIPTVSEEYSKLMEYMRKGQEAAATLAHLRRAEGDAKGILIANGWMAVSENLKRMQYVVGLLAQGRLQ